MAETLCSQAHESRYQRNWLNIQGRLPGRRVTCFLIETRKMVEMRGWEQGHSWEVKVRGAGGLRMQGRTDIDRMMLTPWPGQAQLVGWQARVPQLWLGSISCLFARGVINNHLPATGSTEASQGTAWRWGQSPAWWPGKLDSGIIPATRCEPWPSHLSSSLRMLEG